MAQVIFQSTGLILTGHQANAAAFVSNRTCSVLLPAKAAHAAASEQDAFRDAPRSAAEQRQASR